MLRALWIKLFRQSPGEPNRGEAGERVAERYLRSQHGYRLVARNWRNPRNRREELDLVMHDGDVLVFVEVKTRSEEALVSGYHAIDRRKRDALRRAIRSYLRLLTERPLTHRFDVVEVRWPDDADDDGAGAEVLHYTNVRLQRRR